MQKYISLIFIFLLLAITTISTGETYIADYDGVTWRNWDERSKIDFIRGYISGANYTIGKFNSLWQPGSTAATGSREEAFEEIHAGKNLDWNIRVIETDMNLSMLKSLVDKFSISSITDRTISDGLDVFYKDFKNRRVKIADAIHVVKQQIMGIAPEDIEQIVLNLRGGEKGYVILSNDNGDVIKFIPFP